MSTTIPVDLASGGMTTDIRDETNGVVKLTKHFDILTRPKSITPYHSQVTADSLASTNRIRDFVYMVPTNTTVPTIFARGGPDQNTGGYYTYMFYQDTFNSSTWKTTSNNKGTHLAINGVLVSYHDYIYGLYIGGNVWKYDPTGSAAWVENDSGGSIGATSNLNGKIANGVVHSKDDCLYMAASNTIARNNNGSWTLAALTLPTKYTITAMCEYGNYLAIACAPNMSTSSDAFFSGEKSVVYLWDRDSSLTTLSEVIDFGYGTLKVLEQVDGELIGISLRRDLFTSLSTRMIFRRYAGGTPTVFRELVASSMTGLQLVYGQKYNANRLYFLAAIEIDGTLHSGIWGVGKNKNGNWIVWHDTLPNNDTDVVSGGGLVGFYRQGDYSIVSYVDVMGGGGFTNNTGYNLTMTTDSAVSYAGTSVIETVINPGMTGSAEKDRSALKQLQAIAVSFDPLPDGAQVVLKYKADGVGWTTVFTETTDGRVVTEMTYDSSGTAFTSAREYQFRIESTGGAIITGLKYKYETLNTLI